MRTNDPSAVRATVLAKPRSLTHAGNGRRARSTSCGECCYCAQKVESSAIDLQSLIVGLSYCGSSSLYTPLSRSLRLLPSLHSKHHHPPPNNLKMAPSSARKRKSRVLESDDDCDPPKKHVPLSKTHTATKDPKVCRRLSS